MMAQISSQKQDGKAALVLAASKGELDTVRYCIEHGADKEATGPSGMTALIHAARSGRLEEVKYLIEQGAST